MTTPSATRLYYDDAYLLTFESVVIDTRRREGRCEVALASSAFYPTSGGQLNDTGTLTPTSGGAALSVVDVHDDDEGVVWHVLEGDLSPETQVVGAVDGVRRADHRQQHTGQHVLSASFASVCGAETRSVHLGRDLCTLDLDRDIGDGTVASAEEHANAVVRDDRTVLTRYVDATEAATLPLRRATGRSGMVRLVEVAGHDLSACGGTHVRRTGEIGAILIRGAERFKGGARVTFVCGGRAVALHGDLRRTLDAAARQLSVGIPEVPGTIVRLQEEARELRRAHEAALERLADFDAQALAEGFERANGCDVLVAAQPEADGIALRRMATVLVDVPGRVVVLLGGATPHALVVARSSDLSARDAGQIARAIAAEFGGKAGGRPDLAQGGGISATAGAVRDLLHGLLA